MDRFPLPRGGWRSVAFAFRGYNTVNLGRTPELLDHPKFGPIVEVALREGSEICREASGREVDLVERVRNRRETCDLTTYAEDVALVVSVSLAQIRILEDLFGLQFPQARLAFGYSLGEASALIATGAFGMKELLRVPIALADDSVALAHDVTMGVLFSRGPALDEEAVRSLCLEINQGGDGVIAPSAILSPNCILLLGQGATLNRFQEAMKARLERGASLRRNPHRWPPLHTPIVWQKAIPNRAAMMLQSTAGGLTPPAIPILSSVTGESSYTATNSRDLLHRWVDHPQQLWKQILGVVDAGVSTIIHVGPDPNLIPATFKRLSDDIRGQLRLRRSLRVVSSLAHRPWLAKLLPKSAALLRVPTIQHINLEDWLLDAATIGQRRAG